ncbi:hypothetical protein ACFWWT_48205 [Streptomyces sp. NPDC058676]|uniref:hypothetical protein n=1 Tax=unclassified Streptomyces TaxID=2593676 RepID=UPI00364BB718
MLLRSRRGTDMTASFPEIRAAALAQLPEDIGLDGELVVWERDRLAFERLQQRLPGAGQLPLRRRGSGRRTSCSLSGRACRIAKSAGSRIPDIRTGHCRG